MRHALSPCTSWVTQRPTEFDRDASHDAYNVNTPGTPLLSPTLLRCPFHCVVSSYCPILVISRNKDNQFSDSKFNASFHLIS